MADLNLLKTQFIELYGGAEKDITVFHAPGRVNLIGEHTDYNGGYVFPAALTFGTTLLLRKNNEGLLRMASTNFAHKGSCSLDDIVYREEDDWMNYPKGVVAKLQQKGQGPRSGYDMLYHGEIPNGAGLSSSASIEVVTGYGLLEAEGYPADRVELALLAQKAENEFMGVNCGIMDQFAVANGRKDHAILLMCDTLEYELVPFQSGSYKLVIGNTNKRRGLVDSAYNERRSQCEQAVRDLQTRFPDLTLLGQISLEQFEANKDIIKDDIVRRRAQHVVQEIDRVLKSIDVLKANDLEAFGRLMTGSHESLRDLYEVTCRELDVMVEAALSVPGVLGSRMTGAGFGGCTVSLVHEDSIEAFREKVGSIYKEQTGLTGDFYVCSIGDGVNRVQD
ncbi:galactokinase [Paenibacillus chitinolyticus]|uniref:Galactokinase n=2 Tax=Paenibacillus chitinolyticus TaxID=79263 RepID=A0A410WPB1_9BACL|nr:galactokinase [Paenibacillus chitinolyticus]MCY9590746.1 galactokinase [Paenibacillus chitinolyticus]QAV16193.1 galactokinase [Paenibacillus chitinolyticus]